MEKIEAMAAGVAVIATRVGGVVEKIESEQSGLLVLPQDPAALAEAIVRLAHDPDFRVRLGDAAKARAVRLFPLEKAIEGYEDVSINAAARH